MNELGVGRREGEHPQRKSHTIIASLHCSLCIHYRNLVIFRKSTTLALFFFLLLIVFFYLTFTRGLVAMTTRVLELGGSNDQ